MVVRMVSYEDQQRELKRLARIAKEQRALGNELGAQNAQWAYNALLKRKPKDAPKRSRARKPRSGDREKHFRTMAEVYAFLERKGFRQYSHTKHGLGYWRLRDCVLWKAEYGFAKEAGFLVVRWWSHDAELD